MTKRKFDFGSRVYSSSLRFFGDGDGDGEKEGKPKRGEQKDA